LDTIPSGILFHKQHDLCSLVPQGHYINIFPIQGNILNDFHLRLKVGAFNRFLS
jgi:hypothetical protein